MQPKPYDLSDPAELKRLFFELEGYMRISMKDGTDHEGRRHAYDALRRINRDDDCRPIREALMTACGVEI